MGIQEASTTHKCNEPQRREGHEDVVALEDAKPRLRRAIGRAIEVHRTLGPGLQEGVYEACLCREPTQGGVSVYQAGPDPTDPSNAAASGWLVTRDVTAGPG